MVLGAARLDSGLVKENGGKELAVVDVEKEEKDGKELAMREVLEENVGKVFAVDDLTEVRAAGKVLTRTGVGMEDDEADMEGGEGDKLLVIGVEVDGGADAL